MSKPYTATRTRNGSKTTVTITDANGTVTDRTTSATMVYVEVLVSAEGKVLARSQSRGGTIPTERRLAAWHPRAMALPVIDAPSNLKQETTMSDLQPIALHTTPSGKVTKWGVPGHVQEFKAKYDALNFIKALAEHAPAPEAPKAEEPKAPKAPKEPKAPKAKLTDDERKARRRERRAARLAKLDAAELAARKAKRAEARKARRAAKKAAQAAKGGSK